MDPECIGAVGDAGQLLESLGHQVDYSAPDELFHEEFFEHFRTIVSACNVAMLAGFEAALGRPMARADTEGDTWALMQMGREVTGLQYVSAVEWSHAWTRRLSQWWDDHDVLVSPIMAEPPPKLGELRNPETGRGPAERPSAVHGAVERGRAAGDVGATALDRKRPAGGRAVRGPSCQRGDAAVTGRSA